MCTTAGVLEGLAEDIEQLEIPADADVIAEVLTLRRRLDAALAAAVAELFHPAPA